MLKQLVAYVGLDHFLAGLRDYFAAHAFGNATFDDLLGALEKASGRDLSDWGRQWLKTTGLNTLRADFDVDADGRFTRFAITQGGATPGAGETRVHRLAVGIYDDEGTGRLIRVHREEFDIAVRYGPGGWDDVVSVPLGEGRLIPVCKPAVFARANGDLATLLASTRKIQSSASNEWRAWAVEAKLPVSAVTPTFTMEEFTVAISGALAGEGLALAPDVRVRDRLARGELVQFSDITVKPGYAYHIVHAPNAARRPILVDLCYECLSTDKKLKVNLIL